MIVTAGRDTFTITDQELQTVLKTYVEAQTGRKVEGSVYVNTSSLHGHIGDPRNETYTASGNLENKKA